MSTTTAAHRAGRLTAALGAAVMASVGVIAADVPASVVTPSTLGLVSSTVADAAVTTVTTVTTVASEAGATSPSHVPSRLA